MQTKSQFNVVLTLLALTFLICPIEAADQAAPHPDDPIGVWRGVLKLDQDELDVTLIIARNPKGKLVGQWSSRRGSQPLKLIDYQKGWLSFLRTQGFARRPGTPAANNNRNSIDIDFSGQIDGDSLNGHIFIFNNPVEFNAKRNDPGVKANPDPEPGVKTKPKPEPNLAPGVKDKKQNISTDNAKTPTTHPALIGTWRGHTKTQSQTRPVRLIIDTQQNGLLITDDKTMPITSLVFSGENLLVAVRAQTPQKERTINIELTLEDQTLTGLAFFADQPERTLGEVKLTKPNKKATP